MRHPRHGGETHRVMTRLEFLARVGALIPPLRYPLVRYRGGLAPNSPWRAMVVPGPRGPHHRDRARRRSGVAQAITAAGAGDTATLPQRDWATLLQGVLWIAVIRDRAAILRIRAHIGEDGAPPRMHRARDPC